MNKSIKTFDLYFSERVKGHLVKMTAQNTGNHKMVQTNTKEKMVAMTLLIKAEIKENNVNIHTFKW